MEKTYKHFLILLLLIVAIFSDALPLRSLGKTANPILVSNNSKRSDLIKLSLTIPEPKISPIQSQIIRGSNTVRPYIGNCPFLNKPGKPKIPRIPVRIILPYGKGVNSIQVIGGKPETSILEYPLAWDEMDQPISSQKRIKTDPDSRIYNSNKVFPEKLYGNFEIQKAFGVSIALIDIYPLTYNAKANETNYYKNLSLKISLKNIKPSHDIRVDVEKFRKRGFLSEENEKVLATYPLESNRGETYDYIFITSADIANNVSFSPNVQDLISLRESQGFTCKLITVEEINTSVNGSSKKNKIRKFIKDAYNNWGTKFVTLGGDVDIVAHQTITVWYGWDRVIASDMPYQCLDGETWNGDYEAEVYVGRISVENAEEMSNQIHKIIQYETEPSNSEMLNRSLGAGEHLDYQNWGMYAIEHLYGEVYPSYWDHDSLYGKIEEWGQQDLIDILAKNRYGNVDHDGHATENGTLNIGVGETDRLTNSKYPFLYTLSCLAGKYTVDCIAEELMSEHKVGGFFGGVLNSDVGLYSQNNSIEGSSPELQRQFWKAFWEAGRKYLSEFNAYSHQMAHSGMAEKFTCATTNYFGDAATRFRGKESGVVKSKKIINNYLSKYPMRNISNVCVVKNKINFKVNKSDEIAIKMYTIDGKNIFKLSKDSYKKGVHFIDLKSYKLSKAVYLVSFMINKSISTYKLKY